LVLAVMLFGVCATARAASAQELAGTELSAAIPGIVLGSSSARMVRSEGFDPFVRGARFASCDPARGEYCAGTHVAGIDMNTFPRFKLNLDLPSHFTLEGHLWSMTHDEVNLEVRQAVLGTALRRQDGNRWYEVGFGMAERSEAKNETNDPRGVDGCQPGPIQPALLAGIGTAFAVGDHMWFDLRLRGGMAVGEGADVYHANLVVGFDWQ
jgi:hypothetical protein